MNGKAVWTDGKRRIVSDGKSWTVEVYRKGKGSTGKPYELWDAERFQEYGQAIDEPNKAVLDYIVCLERFAGIRGADELGEAGSLILDRGDEAS